MVETENTFDAKKEPAPAKDSIIDMQGPKIKDFHSKADFDEEFSRARILEGVTVTKTISAKQLRLRDNFNCAGASLGCLSVITGVSGGAILGVREAILFNQSDIVLQSLEAFALGGWGAIVGGLIGMGGCYMSMKLTDKVLEKVGSGQSNKSSSTTSLIKLD